MPTSRLLYRADQHQPQSWLRLLALVAPALILAACGSAPQKPAAPDSLPTVSSVAPKTAARRNLPALPAAGSGRGGYYMDDGPGDAPPDDLLAIPDAEPRIEPYSKTGNRPYVVFGQRYTPITDDQPLKQRGVGSWYGKKFHGQKTSSGELYDMYQMTAAHPTLPIPSYARVTNLATGVQVIVRVNDRGPFRSSRIIDLSYTAALKLGYLHHGSTQLEVERLLPDEILRLAAAKKNLPASVAQVVAPVSTEVMPPVPLPALTLASVAGSAGISAAAPVATSAASSSAPLVAPSSVTAAAGGGYYLQLGAYSQMANAEALRARLAANWSTALPPLDVVQYDALFRVHSGPFGSRSEALDAVREMRDAGATKPLIVQR